MTATMTDAQRWVKELKDAGWVRLNLTTWCAPCGCHYRGPATAHRLMGILKTRNCPNVHRIK